MSDVGIGSAAPPSSAPSGSPAAPPQQGVGQQGSVPIDPNQVNIPNPVGSQAPAKAGMSLAEARRASIQEAFRKSRDPEWQRSRPGPAQAAKGHNQPPEPTANEPPARRERGEGQAPFDLKKRPVEEPRRRRQQQGEAQTPPAAGPQRGDGGRFAPRQAQPPGGAQAPRSQQGGYTPANNPLPANDPHREPPPRMTEQAKSQWHTVPAPVRGEFVRMHREFAHAHQRYDTFKKIAAAYEPVRAYDSLARRQGTTLDRVLNNFTSIEHKLRSDPIGGLDLIVNNLNLQAPDGRRLGLRDVAWHVLNQSPEQLALLQQRNAQAAHAAQLAQMRQQQAALAQQQQRMQYENQFRQTRSGVDRFAETHPRLDELGPVIERELKLGFGLEQAYQRACMLVPAARAAGGQQSQRQPDRSIHGAPSGGPSNGAQQRRGKSVGRREAIANALAFVRGSL